MIKQTRVAMAVLMMMASYQAWGQQQMEPQPLGLQAPPSVQEDQAPPPPQEVLSIQDQAKLQSQIKAWTKKVQAYDDAQEWMLSLKIETFVGPDVPSIPPPPPVTNDDIDDQDVLDQAAPPPPPPPALPPMASSPQPPPPAPSSDLGMEGKLPMFMVLHITYPSSGSKLGKDVSMDAYLIRSDMPLAVITKITPQSTQVMAYGKVQVNPVAFQSMDLSGAPEVFENARNFSEKASQMWGLAHASPQLFDLNAFDEQGRPVLAHEKMSGAQVVYLYKDEQSLLPSAVEVNDNGNMLKVVLGEQNIITKKHPYDDQDVLKKTQDVLMGIEGYVGFRPRP